MNLGPRNATEAYLKVFTVNVLFDIAVEKLKFLGRQIAP